MARVTSNKKVSNAQAIAIRIAEARVRVAERKLRELKESARPLSEYDPDHIDPNQYADEYESEEERAWRRGAADVQIALKNRRDAAARRGLREGKYTNYEGRLGKALQDKIEAFNAVGRARDKEGFLSLLDEIVASGTLSTEAVMLADEIRNETIRNFNKGYAHAYNVMFAGKDSDNKVLR